MAEFASLTHKFRANIEHPPAVGHKINKRNRQPLSCAPCRIKKLRCDRGHPCDACVKRGDTAGCTYGKAALGQQAPNTVAAMTTANGSGGRAKVQERLRSLEELVMNLVENGTTPSDRSGSIPTESSHVSPSLAKEGHLQYGSSESRYVGSTHWSAILQNIQELKTALGTENPSSTDLDESEDVEPQPQDPENIFGPTGDLSLNHILAQYLPPRTQVDRCLSMYFNSRYLVVPYIHGGQFQRQYEQFWRTPLDADPLWVSILFSICCMSATLSEALGSESSTPPDQASPRINLMTAACQCLRLGGFVRPKRYVVEALGLYASCKYMATLDPSREVGIIFAILVRLAFRGGYHRDPSQFRHFGVFEGEMRRRTWATMRQFDLMISFQLGLPQQIPPYSWDTQAPRNLLEIDFDEHTTELPGSRPENEPTQILYFIVKSRLMTSFGKICTHALSFRDCTQQEVMDLDAEVRAEYQTTPDILRIRPMSQSYADPAFLVMVRLNLEFLYQKSLCVLHRKYMTQGGYPSSTVACIDAAVAITTHMLDIHKELKPGGQLYSERWTLSSFTMNDFYLASTVLCLALSKWKKDNPNTEMADDATIRGHRELLKSAFAICEELSATSTEASRVARVLRVVLGEMGIDLGPTSLSPPESSNSASDPTPPTPASSQKSRSPPPTRLSIPYARGPRPSQAMATTAAPFSHNVNLDPLTLNDVDVLMPKPQPQPPTFSLLHKKPEPGVSSYTALHHGAFPSQDQSVDLTSYPYASTFFPFSPPHSTTAFNLHSNGSGGGTDPTLDIDWALLDQWMALPETDHMSWSDGNDPSRTTTATTTTASHGDDVMNGGEKPVEIPLQPGSTVANTSATVVQDWATPPFLLFSEDRHQSMM